MKTVIITGTSSGIGKETALYFAEKGWNVVATMRNPDSRKTELHGKENIHLLHLDVLDRASIVKAISDAKNEHGKIDALVNNAGYAMRGPFEASTHEQVKKQFDTNVNGLMDVTREIIPVFRAQNDGTIINVASVAGRITFPFYSLYNSTKWAVEGFSEALQYELRPFNIKVKIIEPGIIKTDFYNRSMDVTKKEGLTAYDTYLESTIAATKKIEDNGSEPIVVARTIFRAANDDSWRLRYKCGKMASTMLALRKILPDGMYMSIIKSQTMK